MVLLFSSGDFAVLLEPSRSSCPYKIGAIVGFQHHGSSRVACTQKAFCRLEQRVDIVRIGK
jgi:hypothetical protein